MFERVCRVPGCPTSMVLPMLHPDSPSASAWIEIRWSPDGLAGPCANFLHGLCDKWREGSNEMQRKLLDPKSKGTQIRMATGFKMSVGIHRQRRMVVRMARMARMAKMARMARMAGEECDIFND